MEKIEIIQFTITVIVIFLVLGGFIISFIFFYKNRQLLNQKKIREMEAEFRQELLQAQLEIQEQTVNHVSQEIHDNIGQVLSLAKLNIGTIDIYQPEQAQSKINDSHELLGKAIQDLRQLARSMSTSCITDMGLLRSIENEVEMIYKSGAFLPQLHVEGHVIKINPQRELIVFRIFQELINNIIKHAAAKKVDIRIVFTEEFLNITVIDDGNGFDTTHLSFSGNSTFGLGLRNMKNRAQLIGADFSITSIPGTGTTANIRLPLSTE